MSLEKRVRVWDRFVRVFHWSLVICFFVAYGSTKSIGMVHKGFGYATLALVAARIVWGFFGTRHARFSDVVPGARRWRTVSLAMLLRREPGRVGHNLAGSVTIVLCAVTSVGVTGWLLTLDALRANGALETLHAVLVDVTLVALLMHVCATVYASLRQRENWSMLTGYKRSPGGSPARRSRARRPDHREIFQTTYPVELPER